MNTAGLSLDQAPPISVPFRFFLTAPLFGAAAGILLLFMGPVALENRWMPGTLALTHLLTLGFIAMVMCGALLQMLPVIAASPVPAVVPVGVLTHLLLVLGTLLLATAFLLWDRWLMVASVLSLGLAFLLFTPAVGLALWRVQIHSPTTRGMGLATAAMIVTISLGVVAATAYFGQMKVAQLPAVVDIHLSWGLLGWVGILLISVSFQVVPMFQVTPEYPRWLTKYLPAGIFIGLLGWLVLRYWLTDIGLTGSFGVLWIGLLALAYAVFALVTIRLQQRRKRRIRDVTLLFWRTAMVMMVIGLLVWILGSLIPAIGHAPQFPLFIGMLMLVGVALPVINGMLYKILPFLSWFHLQNRQLAQMCMTVNVPHMKGFVSDTMALWQYRFYLISLLTLLLATLWPDWFGRAGGLSFAISNLLLLANLLLAVHRYRVTDRALTAAAVG